MIVGILQNENIDSINSWIAACKKKDLAYKVIDLTKNDWLENVQSEPFAFFLLRPSGNNQRFKALYDERVFIISKVLGYNVFPSYEECYIYENKRLQSYFLKANNIPHPETSVFYHHSDALNFIEKTTFPIVAKTNIGAAGSGVKIIKTKNAAKKYLKTAFKKGGIRRRLGPNRVTGSPKKWFIKAVQDPSYFRSKIKAYLTSYGDAQKGFVIFQKFVPHKFEWRVIKIGESYFAHKKLAYKGKASGVKQKEFTDPPKKLLTFCKDICDSHNFQSMSIDLFEDSHGGYMVNELQTIWGHKADPVTGSFYRLAVNGVPGRYLFKNNQWVFEEGDYNTNESCDLRLDTALQLFGLKP